MIVGNVMYSDNDYQLIWTIKKRARKGEGIMKWNRLMLAFALLTVFIIVGCSAESSDVSKQEEEKEDATAEIEQTNAIIDALGNEITFEKTPESFAALNPGEIEMLVALGANVVGRPTTHGPAIPGTEQAHELGNPHNPNFEKIAEANPDVLIVPPSFQQYANNLQNQGMKVVYTEANSVEDIQTTLKNYGVMLNKVEEAQKIIDQIDTDIAAIEKAQPVRTLLVYGAPGTYLAALPTSLSGDILEKVGGENIAADFPKEDQYPQYASLSVEKIIERNPEAVMLITHGDPEAVRDAFENEMMKNPAWKNLDAVKAGNVTVLPSHLFGTNPGTKIVDALEEMKNQLQEVQ